MRTIADAISKLQPRANAEFSTIRARLLKITARVHETATRVRLAFAANCPDAILFHGLLRGFLPHPT